VRELHKLTRKSPISGKFNEMTLNYDHNDYLAWAMGDKLIQEAFPYLTADEREFIQTGITKGEWDSLNPEEDQYDGS